MSRRLSRAMIVGCSALALLAGPVISGLPYLGTVEVYAAGKANGAAKGKSQKKAANKSSSAQNAKAARGTSPKAKLVAAVDEPAKAKNIHAQLGGLNSLNRNINGLMNSADPRMDAIRSFVQSSADLVAIQAELSNVEAGLASALDAYNALAASMVPTAYDGNPAAYSDLSIAALQARLVELNGAYALDPENTAVFDEITALSAAIDSLQTSPELLTLTDLQQQVDALSTQEADALAATDDATLVAALNGASNTGPLSEDALQWARQKLGVGAFDGLIDDYIARQ